MKSILPLLLLFALPSGVAAQRRDLQQGTIVRMRMADCLNQQHKFMAQISGAPTLQTGGQCPEYVLVAEKVVYVISGKNSERLIPLAEITRFRLQKNEMLIRIDDASKESHFRIRTMMLRADWERKQLLEEAEANAMISHHLDAATIREQH